MPFKIVRNDIAKMAVDAIVSTANPMPLVGYGVDSSIHEAAGPELLEARQEIGDIAPGKAAVTKGFNLSAKYVIHTVGPVWMGGNCGEGSILRQCYRSCLALCREYGFNSVAFPIISAGTYGFPKDLALSLAISEIQSFLEDNEIDIYLVVHNKEVFEISKKLRRDVESYIDEHSIWERAPEKASEPASKSKIGKGPLSSLRKLFRPKENRPFDEFDEIAPTGELEPDVCLSAPLPCAPCPAMPDEVEFSVPDLDELLRKRDIGFSQALIELIDKSGHSDSYIYKKANVDRRLFSKIRSKPNYQPSRTTALAFAFALELSLDDTRDLIGKAGYALSNASVFDLIVLFFLERGNYNIYELNEVLFSYDQPLVGG